MSDDDFLGNSPGIAAPSRRFPFSLSDWLALAATLLYVLPALALSRQRGNSEFVMYAAVLLLLLAAVAAVHRRVGFHPAAIWGLWLWGLLHMCGGLVAIPESWPVNAGEPHVLYNWWIAPGWLKYDQLVHACGFGLTTWLCWQGLRRALLHRGADPRPTFGLLVLSAASGMGFGALNEVIEFLATVFVPDTNVGGYANTGWDLVFNMLGSVVSAGLIAWTSRK